MAVAGSPSLYETCLIGWKGRVANKCGSRNGYDEGDNRLIRSFEGVTL